MNKVINIANAHVKTAAVEVKALTISGKQVTLAVFRQLLEEELINLWTGKFNGLPWGTVNYHPGSYCHDIGEHLHIVWQKGTELRRSLVTMGADKRLYSSFNNKKVYLNRLQDKMNIAWILERTLQSCINNATPYWIYPKEDEEEWNLYFPDSGCWFTWHNGFPKWNYTNNIGTWSTDSIPPNIFSYIDCKEGRCPIKSITDVDSALKLVNDYGNHVYLWNEEEIGSVEIDKNSFNNHDYIQSVLSSIKLSISENKELYNNRVLSWNARYNELSSLDQLFIAV